MSRVLIRIQLEDGTIMTVEEAVLYIEGSGNTLYTEDNNGNQYNVEVVSDRTKPKKYLRANIGTGIAAVENHTADLSCLPPIIGYPDQ